MRRSLLKNLSLERRSRSEFPWMDLVRSVSNAWPSRFVDSHGNYQDEVFLERHDAPLYKHQRDLPRLPVPTLDETIKRFLATALPLAKNNEEARTLQVACDEFLEQAKPLQGRLLERQANLPDTSWLQQWWNQQAYLQYREPVVVHVSYLLQLADDPSAPSAIPRAAAVLRAAAQYRQNVCSGTLPQDTIGNQQTTTPLCSVAYKYMFHACRIPQPGQDCYRIYDPSEANHAAVAYQNQFFAIPVFDDDGNVLPLSAMEHNLLECQARAQDSTAGRRIDLGWLTTWNRDEWAHARSELLRMGGPTMRRALETLESSMLLVCLDEEQPVSYGQRAEEYWHGGLESGGNRWCDKSFQMVISNNAKLGLVGEHSMMDGMPAVGFCDYLNSQTYQKQMDSIKDSSTAPEACNRGVVDIFEDAFSNLSDDELCELKVFESKAKRDFSRLIEDYEIQVESFQGYGSTFIKKAGYSPDAYVQVAIQLATFRLFGGTQVGTYESTQVRPFLHGRTEVTRSVSLASKDFVDSMGLEAVIEEPDDEKRNNKLELFRKATASHVVYTRDAVQGLGVDRHFLGLSQLLEPGEECPALFSHPLYLRSKRWRVSTSTIPHQPGFGPVECDGVGVGYTIKPSSCIFTVTSRTDNAFVDPLCHLLEEALVEIESLLELEAPLYSKL